jgi:N-acetyltransferase 10
LLIVDEAAAIPLTLVKNLLGPYMVILSSTVHGYEGTGRSLSLKLVQNLKENNRQRQLKEMEMTEPIRYGLNDPIEKWLNELLCLDATRNVESLPMGLPHPNECDLFYVNRDTLFSYHGSTERFLNKIMNIFVSSHYKNTPNDLQLLSDAPAHHIFVLMGSLNQEGGDLPDVLCAIQVCFEGRISSETFNKEMKRGVRPSGDLIPWTVSE